MRTRLRALLAALHPAELVLPKGGLDEATGKVLKAAAGSIRTNNLDFVDAAAGRQEISDGAYFTKQGECVASLPVWLCLSLGRQNKFYAAASPVAASFASAADRCTSHMAIPYSDSASWWLC